MRSGFARSELAPLDAEPDIIAARLKAITTADWPDMMKENAVRRNFELLERYVEGFMKELGGLIDPSKR